MARSREDAGGVGPSTALTQEQKKKAQDGARKEGKAKHSWVFFSFGCVAAPFLPPPTTTASSSASAPAATPPPPAPEQQTLSVKPERRPPVRELLAELDRALNHLAQGPGAQIADLFPRLRAEFWKAACEIAVSGLHSSHPFDI
ncbi:hypothetical protein ColTof4_14401 [Colletotrichum tofieldiae]|nr:hypothetical protein ColTof3_14879 [Colletotrichum tofieldiae]GKT81978.1 hypothetical protein ColTof4_14401 [Colletotrichum tofieldiae]